MTPIKSWTILDQEATLFQREDRTVSLSIGKKVHLVDHQIGGIQSGWKQGVDVLTAALDNTYLLPIQCSNVLVRVEVQTRLLGGGNGASSERSSSDRDSFGSSSSSYFRSSNYDWDNRGYLGYVGGRNTGSTNRGSSRSSLLESSRVDWDNRGYLGRRNNRDTGNSSGSNTDRHRQTRSGGRSGNTSSVTKRQSTPKPTPQPRKVVWTPIPKPKNPLRVFNGKVTEVNQWGGQRSGLMRLSNSDTRTDGSLEPTFRDRVLSRTWTRVSQLPEERKYAIIHALHYKEKNPVGEGISSLIQGEVENQIWTKIGGKMGGFIGSLLSPEMLSEVDMDVEKRANDRGEFQNILTREVFREVERQRTEEINQTIGQGGMPLWTPKLSNHNTL